MSRRGTGPGLLKLPRDPVVDMLDRFVDAQRSHYPAALAELQRGRKVSHWMWFVFPQLRGLGSSEMAHRFGLDGIDEACAYVAHPVLGPRLRECVNALLGHQGIEAASILGDVDAMKLRSCLTLFAIAAPCDPIYGEAIKVYFGGVLDDRTAALLDSKAKADD